MEEPRVNELEVPGELGGARLDRVLATLVEGVSRTRLQALVRDGRVRVGGEPVRRPNTPVEAGARIEVEVADRREEIDEAALPDLPVLYSDEHMVAIDKPAGLVAHRSEQGRGGTVADIARTMFGELPSVQGEDRPGIVHRLDRLTSGVMVLGRTMEALEHLKAQFQARSVVKEYRAIAHGEPRFDSDWIEHRIAPAEGRFAQFRALRESDRETVLADTDEASDETDADPVGREASTFYEVLDRFRGFVHLRCQPKTGRTHQIRVHLQAEGIPIVGDRQYGPRGGLRHPLPAEAPKMDRQALHAHKLELEHPVSGERLTFEAPVPEDMAQLLEWLRGHAAG